MIKNLWPNVSLENYNQWHPLTGTINEIPDKYKTYYSTPEAWFTAFALRAENDINAYLDFILYKFPFETFKDNLIKETLVDMVYVMIEHWVFNRIPIESLSDLATQFTNGINLNAQSMPTINIFDLAPSRLKNLAQLTQLKQLIYSYDNDEIDLSLIDLGTFYSRVETDALLAAEKQERIQGDETNKTLILEKQLKLYDDVLNDQEKESQLLRGPVTKFVNRGYVATTYDRDTETMILDWPSEIGTLSPQVLQPNPQVGDVTHAATADFSAKLQKQITTNQNDITKLKSNIWIEGEYKWMPTTVTEMPKGWKKAISDNFLTPGHVFSLAQISALPKSSPLLVVRGSTNSDTPEVISGMSEAGGVTAAMLWIKDEKTNTLHNYYHQNATLWQYDPNNKFQK